MDINESNNQPISQNLTVKDLDIEFLPIVYDIIRSVERDPHDPSQKNRESQDSSHKVVELQKKLDLARSQVRQLQGIEYSKADQLKKVEILKKQLQLKRELVTKYRTMCTFDIPK